MSEWIKFQAKVYNLLPTFMRRTVNNLRLLPYYLQWYFHHNGRRHAVDRLRPMQGLYEGCRCIVIGNGPSLNQMNLGFLEGEYTFGLNRIYLLFDELGFETSFLVSINGLVMRQFADEIKEVKSLKLLNWLHRDKYRTNEDTIFLCAKPSDKMNGHILDGYFAGSGTVTNLALEIAYFLGFSEVILIGVDHSYKEKGDPGMPIVSESTDNNHFSPDYFGKGTVWQLPNYKAMELGYSKIRKLFEDDNRVVVDATVGGNLHIFPKVGLWKYLKESKYKNKQNEVSSV